MHVELNNDACYDGASGCACIMHLALTTGVLSLVKPTTGDRAFDSFLDVPPEVWMIQLHERRSLFCCFLRLSVDCPRSTMALYYRAHDRRRFSDHACRSSLTSEIICDPSSRLPDCQPRLRPQGLVARCPTLQSCQGLSLSVVPGGEREQLLAERGPRPRGCACA